MNSNSCSHCCTPLADSNDGLRDVYSPGYAVLPDGCFTDADLVCIDCYEKNFFSCDGCEQTLPREEFEGAYCSSCEPNYRVRYRVQFASYSGIVWEEDAEDAEEAERILLDLAEKAKQKGAEVVWKGVEALEVLEPEDCALVPDYCGTARIETWTRADRRRRR